MCLLCLRVGFSVIKTLFDASPDLINARDDATGNNVLHAACYKMPLLGVLYLKNKELDLNAKNKAGQTALHIYTSRGDIGQSFRKPVPARCELTAFRNGNDAGVVRL